MYFPMYSKISKIRPKNAPEPQKTARTAKKPHEPQIPTPNRKLLNRTAKSRTEPPGTANFQTAPPAPVNFGPKPNRRTTLRPTKKYIIININYYYK